MAISFECGLTPKELKLVESIAYSLSDPKALEAIVFSGGLPEYRRLLRVARKLSRVANKYDLTNAGVSTQFWRPSPAGPLV